MGSSDYGRRSALSDHLRSRRQAIASSATADFLGRHRTWVERYGDLAWIRGEEDASFHVQFLAGAILADDPSAFQDYALWTGGVLAARGIATRFLVENLEQVGRAAGQGLDEADRTLVDRIVEAGVGALRDRAASPEEPAREGDAGRIQLSLYLQAILAGDRRAALSVALEAIRSGMAVADVYLDILQPAQHELGRRWERNEITVANEHMATAVTQYVVAQLYSHLDIAPIRRGNAIVTGVRGELHQLGGNMVADMLEADGWNVRFLGTQLPHEAVVQAIDEHEPRLVGVSATVLISLPAVAGLIEDIRRRFGTAVAIMVGGSAFRGGAGVWQDIGADGFGRDLREAVTTADELAQNGVA